MADLPDQRPDSTIRSPSLVLEWFRQTWRSLPQGKSLPAETWARRHWAITRVLWFHIVFMSGYPDEMLSERGVLENKHRYLHKPFTSADLLSETERALDVALTA